MAAMGNRVIIFTCLSLIALSAAKEYVPVLLLQSSDSTLHEIGNTALSKWSSDDFKKYMLKLVNRNQDVSKPPLVMVFAEESLSVEDFSWASEGDYGSYPRLLNESKSSSSSFFPSIHQPLKALEGLREAGFKWIKHPSAHIAKLIGSGKEASILPQATEGAKGIVVLIDLEDASTNEDRTDMLRRHDSFIADAYEKMKTDREVLMVYTAVHSSWYETEERETSSNLSDYEEDDGREVMSSVRRLLAVSDQESANDSAIILTPGKSALLFSNSPPVLFNEESSEAQVLSDRAVSSTWDSRANFSRMTINYKNEKIMLHIIFVNKSKYWSTPYVDLELQNASKVSLMPSVLIEAPLGFSYHCSQNVSFKTSPYELRFQGFQLQGFIADVKPENNIAFGDGYDCVYFFTAAIWSGLFVTMLLGFIMIWGLSMIMDIRTMDRFDDPKGKTITIANAE